MSKLENKNKGEPIWGSDKGDPNSAQFIVGYHPSEIRDRDTNKTLDLFELSKKNKKTLREKAKIRQGRGQGMAAKKKKTPKKKGATPSNPGLYSRVKAAAKKKFKVYPSAYANGWLVREYKKRGGGYK